MVVVVACVHVFVGVVLGLVVIVVVFVGPKNLTLNFDKIGSTMWLLFMLMFLL